MYEIMVDPEKNRMVFTLSGNPCLEDCTEISDALLAALKMLKPGFDIITRVSSFFPRDTQTRLLLETTMRVARDTGMKTVVRVCSNPIVQRQWQHSSLMVGYQAYECASLEEAGMILDGLSA